MGMLQEIGEAIDGLSTGHMLSYLLKKRFGGQVAVTASLKAPSIVVLKLVSEIDPATPVFFCQPQPIFPESEEYRREIVDLLGLTNVKIITQSDPLTKARAFERCEHLWNEAAAARGRTRETIHLNDTLEPYKCWIKAAYHDRSVEPDADRYDVYAGMVIIDVLQGRTTETIDRFMQAHALPYHPKINLHKKPAPTDGPVIGYHF